MDELIEWIGVIVAAAAACLSYQQYKNSQNQNGNSASGQLSDIFGGAAPTADYAPSSAAGQLPGSQTPMGAIASSSGSSASSSSVSLPSVPSVTSSGAGDIGTGSLLDPATVAALNDHVANYNAAYVSGNVSSSQASDVAAAYSSALAAQNAAGYSPSNTITPASGTSDLTQAQLITQPISTVNNGGATGQQLAQNTAIETSPSYVGQYNYIFNPASGTFTPNPSLKAP